MNSVDIAGFGGYFRKMMAQLRTFIGDADSRERGCMFLSMLLLSRARIGPGLTPFAAAYFAVSLDGGPGLGALLAGCLAGAVITGVEASSLFTPAGCAVALSMWLLWDRIRRTKRGTCMDGSVMIPVIAGLAVLLPGLAAAGREPMVWLGVFMAAIAASMMALGREIRLEKGITVPGLLMWSAAVTALTSPVAFGPGPAAAFFASAAAWAGRGAVTGAILGAVCLVSGAGLDAFLLPVCVGAAGDITGMIRPGFVARAVPVTAAIAVMGRGAPVAGVIMCAIAAFVPDKYRERLRAIIAPAPAAGEQVISAFRDNIRARLTALSDAFEELAQACGTEDPAFGEQQLISSMRAALCSGCREYEKCWPGRDSSAVKLFCQLMTAAIEQGDSPFHDGEVPPEILRLCRRGMLVPARLGGMLADFAAQRHRRVRLMGARRLIASEFSQAAQIINAVSQEQLQPVSVNNGAASRARNALIEDGMGVSEVIAMRRDKLEVTVDFCRPPAPALVRRARQSISRALGRPFSAAPPAGSRVAFISGCAMQATSAASMLPADPDAPSGDSHMVREVGDGILLAALSDGMGSGEAAASESRQVLSLISALIKASVPREMVLSAVNTVMLARGGEEMFATVDMLTIDLRAGSAEFIKLSACRSYIIRSGKISCIEGGRLPLGILEQVQPARTAVKLKPGDIIVMITDGVADSLPEGIMRDLMINAADFTPAAMSEALVNAAAARAPRRRDDMTALCVKLAGA